MSSRASVAGLPASPYIAIFSCFVPSRWASDIIAPLAISEWAMLNGSHPTPMPFRISSLIPVE